MKGDGVPSTFVVLQQGNYRVSNICSCARAGGVSRGIGKNQVIPIEWEGEIIGGGGLAGEKYRVTEVKTRSGRSRPKESKGKPTRRVIFFLLLEGLYDGGKVG